VRAFGRLASECADALLVIAGAPGDDQGAMMRAIDSLGRSAGARVHVLGAVDESTKAWLVNHARALAYPSLDEGFGFPILEAQRADTPVVASTAGSIPEIAGPAALLSPPADAEALAANLHWVMTSDEMHDKLVRRGRSNARLRIVEKPYQPARFQLVAVTRRDQEVDLQRSCDLPDEVAHEYERTLEQAEDEQFSVGISRANLGTKRENTASDLLGAVLDSLEWLAAQTRISQDAADIDTQSILRFRWGLPLWI
jgi:hypothetical protein